MRAINKKNGRYFQMSEYTYDKDGSEYEWKDLLLCPEKGEEVNGILNDNEIESLRRKYAGMALQGLCCHESAMYEDRERVAMVCVAMADALIEELRSKI